MGAMVDAGQRCERFAEHVLSGLPVADVQADEIWSFIACKERTRERYLPDAGAQASAGAGVAYSSH